MAERTLGWGEHSASRKGNRAATALSGWLRHFGYIPAGCEMRLAFFLLVFIGYSSDLSYFPQRRKLWFSSTNTVSTLKKCQKHSKHMYDPVLV